MIYQSMGKLRLTIWGYINDHSLIHRMNRHFFLLSQQGTHANDSKHNKDDDEIRGKIYKYISVRILISKNSIMTWVIRIYKSISASTLQVMNNQNSHIRTWGKEKSHSRSYSQMTLVLCVSQITKLSSWSFIYLWKWKKLKEKKTQGSSGTWATFSWEILKYKRIK